MVKIKQNDTEYTIAVPSDVGVGTNGWDTSIKKSTNGVENRAFTLARNDIISDNQYNSYTANSINNSRLGLVDNDYTPLQKDVILNNVSIPDTSAADSLHNLNARTVGLTKPYTAQSPVTISNNVISDNNGFEYPSMYLPNEDDTNPANLVYAKLVNGYRGASLSGTEITPADFEGDYIEQASYAGLITTINATIMTSAGSSGTYLSFTQGDLDQDVEPFTGALYVMRHGSLMRVDTHSLPRSALIDVFTYNSSGDYVADVCDAYTKTSNGDSITTQVVLTTSTFPVDIMLLSDGNWLLLPNQVIATGNIYDTSTGNIYGAFTLYSDFSWIAHWWWKPTKNPSDNLCFADSRIIGNTDWYLSSITQTPFGQTTGYTAAYGSGGAVFCEGNRSMDTSTESGQMGYRAFNNFNYTWCANSYTRGYFMQARGI